MTKAIELPCTFTRHALRADKSVTLTFASALEANAELMAALFPLHQQEVTLLIAADRKAEAVTYKGKKNEDGETPSQELRSVLFLKWEREQENNGGKESFPSYYDRQMRRIIQGVIKNF